MKTSDQQKNDILIYKPTSMSNMQVDDRQLTATDWILIFLMANQRSRIHGKLMFVKELFIASNEIEQISRDLEQTFDFYPSHYGPYSDTFDKTLEELEETQDIIVEVEAVEGRIRGIYEITDKGISRIEKKYEDLPSIVKERISKLKKGADQLGYMGILKHVYTHYPEYAVKSRIRSEVYEH